MGIPDMGILCNIYSSWQFAIFKLLSVYMIYEDRHVAVHEYDAVLDLSLRCLLVTSAIWWFLFDLIDLLCTSSTMRKMSPSCSAACIL
ncbi:unnamed protein product [Trifolium pratense]|uniref:Uncharacterized protein n=1 Tax=Trifolium pratense TaxID=57577 RepID=A0ACB0K131_TRIPR|nr:unnamed protein product [Trifolium pratense]